MGLTNKEALEIVKDDAVIVRSDGIILCNEIGDYRIFVKNHTYTPDYHDGLREIERITAIARSYGADYTYTLVRYNDLPEDKKHKKV